MSLDVSLTGKTEEQNCWECNGTGIRKVTQDFYSANITHNLNTMAREAGIYEALWRPDEIGIEKAAKLIPLLLEGLARLKSDPEHFKKFNPENGWGSYEGLCNFTREYLNACRDNPEASIYISR